MAIFLPMLIETASPAGQPNAALVDAAVKLITHLAAGASAAAFKAAVGALSVEGKRRLQVQWIGRLTDLLSLSHLCCKLVPGQTTVPHALLWLTAGSSKIIFSCTAEQPTCRTACCQAETAHHCPEVFCNCDAQSTARERLLWHICRAGQPTRQPTIPMTGAAMESRFHFN